MKIFPIAILGALVLAASAAFVLSSIQQTSARAYTTGSSRLDYQEDVNSYGREDPRVYDR